MSQLSLVKKLTFVSLIGITFPLFASEFPDPRTLETIECRSIGTSYSDSQQDENLKNIIFKLLFVRYHDSGNSALYTLTVTKINRITGEQIEKIKETYASMHLYRTGTDNSDLARERFIIYIPSNTSERTGQFTSFDLPVTISDPFLLYGWSTVPKTVPYAINYYCKFGILAN